MGVWPDFEAPPQYEDADPRWQDPRLPDFRALWGAARKCGYSIGLHGSMRRDCDLIACPWTDDAEDPDTLIAALCDAIDAHPRTDREQKPHGRIAVILLGDAWVKPIDLSIMPRTA